MRRAKLRYLAELVRRQPPPEVRGATLYVNGEEVSGVTEIEFTQRRNRRRYRGRR